MSRLQRSSRAEATQASRLSAMFEPVEAKYGLCRVVRMKRNSVASFGNEESVQIARKSCLAETHEVALHFEHRSRSSWALRAIVSFPMRHELEELGKLVGPILQRLLEGDDGRVWRLDGEGFRDDSAHKLGEAMAEDEEGACRRKER